MKQVIQVCTIGILTLGLGACTAPEQDTVHMPLEFADQEPVATINGEPVPAALLDLFMDQRTHGFSEQLNPVQRQNLMQETVEMTLLAQAAREQGIHRDPRTAAELLGHYQSTLARKFLQQHLADIEITETDIEGAYERRLAESGDIEYRARHLLLDSEALGLEVIEKLNEGADFADLVDEYSEDSVYEGGDIGWFGPEEMVDEFSAAVRQLEVGEYTDTPVQTPFGWHVILLEDTRGREIPALDDLREDLVREVRHQHIRQLVDDLRAQADIQIKDDGPADND